MQYTLHKRTTEFTTNLINQLKIIKLSPYNKNIVDQLIRSGSSVGANYREACGTATRKDFVSKIALCKKEALETVYWLEILQNTDSLPNLKLLLVEAKELTLIFAQSLITARH